MVIKWKKDVKLYNAEERMVNKEEEKGNGRSRKRKGRRQPGRR